MELIKNALYVNFHLLILNKCHYGKYKEIDFIFLAYFYLILDN